MPLQPCRECGQNVSTEAESCPRCGVPNPTGAPAAPPPPPEPESRGPGVGTVATGVFGGIAGCIVAPFVLGFLALVFLILLATCAG